MSEATTASPGDSPQAGTRDAEAVVAVPGGGRDEAGIRESDVPKRLPDGRSVLAEAARALRGGHHEGGPRRVETRRLGHLEEIPEGHLGRKTLVAGQVADAEIERAAVGWRQDRRRDAHRAKGGRHGFGAAIGHAREIQVPAAQVCGPCRHHRSMPLLSRYASHRVRKPASLPWPSN